MKNGPAQVVGLWVFGMFLALSIGWGIYSFKIQQIPHYQETVERTIQTTGGLQDATVASLNKQLNNHATVSRAKYNSSSKTWVADTSATNDKVQPYGTKVDYLISYKAFKAGFISFGGIKNVHGYSITQTRGYSDSEITTQQGTFANNGDANMNSSNSPVIWGGLVYHFGEHTGADVTIGHGQGLYMSFNVTPATDVKSNIDINNSKEGQASNDNDTMSRRDYYITDSAGNILTRDLTHYTLKAGKTYTFVVKYFNDNTDLQPIKNTDSSMMFYNATGTPTPTSIKAHFDNFNWAVLDTSGKNAQPNGANLIDNASGMNASTGDTTRPNIDGQKTGIANSSISYQNTGMTLTYTGNGSQEWYYAVSEYNGNNIDNFSSLEKGKTYTASVDVKGTVPQAVIRAEFGSGGRLGAYTNINNNSWTRIYYTFTMTKDTKLFWLRVNAGSGNNISGSNLFKSGQTLQLRNFKLETGDTATP